MATHAENYLGRPVKTTDAESEHDWQADLAGRWQALGRKIFVVESTHLPTLREILDECCRLTIVWIMVRTKGNLTYTADRLVISRRTVRRHVLAWRRANPLLIPMPFVIFLRWNDLGGKKT